MFPLHTRATSRCFGALALPLLLAIPGLCGCSQAEPLATATAPQLKASALTDAAPEAAAAYATLHDAAGSDVGVISFQAAEDVTLVSVHAYAESAGIRGMHIHANDMPDNGDGCIADPAQAASTHFASADGHFAVAGSKHGHHAGDMPALFFTEWGEAALQFITDRFNVDDVIGRAVIVHAGADNYNNVPTGDEPTQYTPNAPAASELTAGTGNAGARWACGVITLDER